MIPNKEEKSSINLDDQPLKSSQRQETSSATINNPKVPTMRDKSRSKPQLSSATLQNILKFSNPVSPTIKDQKKTKERKAHRTPILRALPPQASNTSVSQQDKSLLDNTQQKHVLFVAQEASKEVKVEENSTTVGKTEVSMPSTIKEGQDSRILRSSKEQKEKKTKDKNVKEKESKEKTETEDERESQLNHIIEILKKPHEERSDEDLESLAALVAEIAFFKDLENTHGRQRLLKCLSRLTHCEVNRNRVVFRQGEIGTTYYIILKGRVKVTKETWVNMEQEDAQVQSLERAGSLQSNNGELEKNLPASPLHKKPPTLKLVSSDVAELHVGQCFGEISLLRKKPRGATVTALEDCKFAVLEKSDFDKILSKDIGDIQEKLFDEKLGFLNSIQLFSGWNYNLISKLYYHLRNQRFVFNNVIYKEGNKASRMYIVKKGELTVYRRIKLSEPEKVHKMHLLSQKNMYKDVAIAVVGPMELLGEEDILTTGAYSCTVVCTSAEAEVLSMTRKDFIHNVWSEEGAKYYLRSLVRVKLQNYEERTREIETRWTDNKGFLYNLNQASLTQLSKRTSQPDELFQRLEQYYQSPQEADKLRSKYATSPEEPTELDSQTRNNELPLIRPLPSETTNILPLLEGRKGSQSPSYGRETSQRDAVLIPRFSTQLRPRQVSYFSLTKDSPQKGSQDPLSSKQGLMHHTPADLSPLHDLAQAQNGWPETISPIRSPDRSLILSDGPKESPSFLKLSKDYELSPDDDRFSLEGRYRDGSTSNTLRVIEIYKKKLQTDRDSLPLIQGPSDSKVPLKPLKKLDRDALRSRSIPRIRVDARNAQVNGVVQSQMVDRKSVGALEGASSIQEINYTVGEAGSSNILVQGDTFRPTKTEGEGMNEKSYNVHPKVQMLGSLRTKLRVGIIKYQGLKKHLEGPDEMERKDISKNMVIKQLDQSKQNMKLVYGTKLFSEIKKEVTKRFYENKRRKEKISQPNMMHDMVQQYFRSLGPEENSESPGNTEGTERTQETTFRKVESRKVVEKLKMYEIGGNGMELLGQRKKVIRSQSSFLLRQKNYNKEVEEEMQRVYRKMYGVGVMKIGDDKEEP